MHRIPGNFCKEIFEKNPKQKYIVIEIFFVLHEFLDQDGSPQKFIFEMSLNDEFT